jgi:hypothetical protein
MGHTYRSKVAQLQLVWTDGLLAVGMVALVALRTPLASHPVLFGVAAALLVGVTMHRFVTWMEQPAQTCASRAADQTEPVRRAHAA